ncbi:uncharacterized protein LOC141554965 isoform X2 [Sminthopsis crassicaudata]|uniref:uncharacterized protein LOC141554965 isoform X2 n=1 Tax=Sminthopsis crassicaudata TaxID=9301 RepID=UPI003D6977DE
MSCCRWIRKNIFGCCCLTSQEKAVSTQSLDTQFASDELFDCEISNLSESSNSEPKTKSESKSFNQLESLELPKNLIVVYELKKGQKNPTIDSPILSGANISTPSGLEESYRLSPPITRSPLNTSYLQPLEMDSPTDLDTRNVSSHATCSPKNSKNLAQEIEEYLHVQAAKLQEASVRPLEEASMKPLEEIKEADKENMLISEEQSHSAEGVAGTSDIAMVEEAPSETREVVQIAPEHQQEKIPTQSNADDSRKRLSISTHESSVPHHTRSRSGSWP